jgi:hypothetical protein
MALRPDDGTTVDRHSELVVLTLLLDARASPWSTQELARELGGELWAADAVAGLCAAGLAQRCDELVFATRAALRFSELLGGI